MILIYRSGGEQSGITSEEIKNIAKELSDSLSETAGKKEKRELKTAANRVQKEAEKLSRYEDQEELLDGRNSYSKTDTDATFMRLKDDRLRPAYNAQISTENQFITNYSISQNASDTVAFPDHLEKIKRRGDAYKPKNYMGDSAYGSEENYSLLEEHDIQNYLKYNTFHPEKEKNYKKNRPYHRINFSYNIEEDTFLCPAGKKLTYKETVQKKTKSGFISHARVYEYQGCGACPHKPQCTKAEGNRQIYQNVQLDKYREQARMNLDSEYGLRLRKRRGFEVETFFGDLRQNCFVNRFLLRGTEKTEHEFGWLAMAYNLRKIAKAELKKVAACASYSFHFVFVKKYRVIRSRYLVFKKSFTIFPYLRDFSTAQPGL